MLLELSKFRPLLHCCSTASSDLASCLQWVLLLSVLTPPSSANTEITAEPCAALPPCSVTHTHTRFRGQLCLSCNLHFLSYLSLSCGASLMPQAEGR